MAGRLPLRAASQPSSNGSDSDRDKAWRRVQSAARRYDVEISANDWRELSHGGKLG